MWQLKLGPSALHALATFHGASNISTTAVPLSTQKPWPPPRQRGSGDSGALQHVAAEVCGSAPAGSLRLCSISPWAQCHSEQLPSSQVVASTCTAAMQYAALQNRGCIGLPAPAGYQYPWRHVQSRAGAMQVSATSSSCHPVVLQLESSGLEACSRLGFVLQQAPADSSFSLLHAVPSTGTGCDTQRQTAGCPMHHCIVWHAPEGGCATLTSTSPSIQLTPSLW